jgi:1-deoxy-D-xylulose-5-phosphate reductoisomerase
MNMRTVSILGSTGSVGQSTVDLVGSAPDRFKVKALTAHRNASLLIQQARLLKPDIVAIADGNFYTDVKEGLAGEPIEILSGSEGVIEVARQKVDWTMAAIVGFAGLKPVLEAIRHSGIVAIANKEPLVAAGSLVMREAQACGTKILPVDSEHNAIFQVFDQENRGSIERLILTASGGPFRSWSVEQMKAATPEQAVAHPNWSMGAKISVDSATMMNKGLEVIEAHHLFGMPADKIDVLIHPQSVIHSMVEYSDGSVLAQLGAPDMRTPIAYALAWPERMATTGQRLDLARMRQLDFSEPDFKKFPALALAYDCLKAGAASCVALNAANEIAVQAFLDRKIGFSDITRIINSTLEHAPATGANDLESILSCDLAMREKALKFIL